MNLLWTPAQLAVLAKIVDLNGFSAAARALEVPKAAVSRAVADLERGLGVRVLERTTRRVALTQAGKLIYPHAKRLGEEADAARALVARLRAPALGPLRVAAAEAAYGRAILAPLVPRFLECFPDTPLEITLGDAGANGTWDVAICSGTPSDGALRFRELGTPPAVLCATPSYFQERSMPAEPDDLRRHALLTPDSGHAEFRLRLERGARRAEVMIFPKLRASDPAVLHASAAAGLGIGVLPEFLCRQGLGTGRLKLVLPEWTPQAGAPLCAVYPAELEADARVIRFVEFLSANVVPALASGKQ